MSSAALQLTTSWLRSVLDQEPRVDIDGHGASVAVVFRAGEHGPEILFIERATKESDPWSGHMAFPGGRIDPGDEDALAAAMREALEEVSLDLQPAHPLGWLSDLRPNFRLVAVHAHCWWLDGDRPQLDPNYEVAEALWVPVAALLDEQRWIDYFYAKSDSSWPGIQLDAEPQVIWGLTLRFLADLFARLEEPFIELAPWSGS